MAWSLTDVTTKNAVLTSINNALGTAAKISWQNASSVELATTSLYNAGNPFSAPASGQMLLLSAAGSTTTPLQLTSTNFTAAGVTKLVFQTSGSTAIFNGTVASPTGGDMNCDALPVAGQALRTDSLTMTVN